MKSDSRGERMTHWASSVPTVLVVTAEAGEPQLPRASESLAAQRDVQWERRVISGLSMRGALESVHQAVVHASGKFEWAVKLDGDMVLALDTALRELVHRARAAGSPARYTEPVLDWYTGLQIEGVHLMRPEEVPTHVEVTPPFNDRWIADLPAVVCRHVESPAVLHAPDPDLEQSLRFGLQRGVKARSQGAAGAHWLRIEELRRCWRKTGEDRRLAALAGAAVGLGLCTEVKNDPQIVSHGSAEFEGLLRLLEEDRSRSIEVAGLLAQRNGTARAHYRLYRSPTLLVRLLLSDMKRRGTRRWRANPA